MRTTVYKHISPYLTEWQHRFVKGRLCETQLVLTHHQWATTLDEGCQILQKLCSFEISGSLLHWCESYLSNRQQRVVLDGVSSSWADVTLRVPQGSLLGPLFFVIFITDLPEVILPGNTIALYADDCKCSRIIEAADDQDLFQQDLDNLFQWSVQNCMTFNVKTLQHLKP